MSATKDILVIDKKGRPLNNQSIYLYSQGAASPLGSYTSDSYGIANLGTLSDGLYDVKGSRAGYSLRTLQSILVIKPTDYVLADGTRAMDKIVVSGFASISGGMVTGSLSFGTGGAISRAAGDWLLASKNFKVGTDLEVAGTRIYGQNAAGLKVVLGDNAGARNFSIADSDEANVFLVDSNGGVRTSGAASIGGIVALSGGTLGFFNTAPVAKPTSITATASSLWGALKALGLIA